MTISDERLLDLCYDGIEPFLGVFATGSDGAAVSDHGGAVALRVPATPERSLLNVVVFDRNDPAGLVAALPEIEREYADAGVKAWGIWIVRGDREAEAAAREIGMKLDSEPLAMGAAIEEIDLTADVSDVRKVWDAAAVAYVNERAYGLPRGSFGAALDGIPEHASLYAYLIEDDGEVIASTVTLHTEDGDCAVYFVATDPGRRREGLGLRVMTAAVQDAKAANCNTTTLQATKHGAPLYAAMGYRDLGVPVNLWEKRKK